MARVGRGGLEERGERNAKHNVVCCEVTSAYATTQLLFEQRIYQTYERRLRGSMYISISPFQT